jgi:hypothetical protein
MPPYEPPDAPTGACPPHREYHPVLPPQSDEDTDMGWGELPEPDGNGRFHRDRPPHWDAG